MSNSVVSFKKGAKRENVREKGGSRFRSVFLVRERETSL